LSTEAITNNNIIAIFMRGHNAKDGHPYKQGQSFGLLFCFLVFLNGRWGCICGAKG